MKTKQLIIFVVMILPTIIISAKAEESIKDIPIRTDIRYAIALGSRQMADFFDRDKDMEPYFYINLRENGTGEAHHALHIGIPHVVGRALWSMMLAEQEAGIPFPEKSLEIYTRYCKKSFNNKDHLNSFFDPGKNNQRFVEFHNIREGLLGLVALIRGRDSDWARDKAYKMVRKIKEITNPDGRFKIEYIEPRLTASGVTGLSVDATTSGRFVEALMEYYYTTKDKVALELAGIYAKNTLGSAFDEKGRFTSFKKSGGHIHSITSSLCGAAMFAVETNNRQMLKRCRLIMDNGIGEYFSSWGWGDELTPDHPADEYLRGEVNQTGDVIRTALVLGRAGYRQYYEMAETFLRNMLLQGQHRHEDLKRFVRENAAPKGDFEKDVIDRAIGAYAMQLPNDRMKKGSWPLSTLDITSGGVHAMCCCWRDRVTYDKDSIRINLLFDVENEDVSINSSLPFHGRIHIFSKKTKKYQLRIPDWVNRDTVRLEIHGVSKRRGLKFDQGYLVIGSLPKGRTAVVTFDVPIMVKKEKVEDMEYTVKWLGNQVIEIDPPGQVSPMPFPPDNFIYEKTVTGVGSTNAKEPLPFMITFGQGNNNNMRVKDAEALAKPGVNLLTNPGWDKEAGSVTLTGSNEFDDGSTFTEWQLYTIGGSVTFTVQADATAKSAPNILIYNKTSAGDDSAVRKDNCRVPVIPGREYSHGVYIRDIDGKVNTVEIKTASFDSNGDYIKSGGQKSQQATTGWTKITNTFTAPSNAATASFQFRINEPSGGCQFDSAYLKLVD